ncbi:MAG: hypothetical protein QOE82_1129 [Thermoanaerobaculia bacterium]|jgi:O-antigen ligase|nr:hypothetical protein [Thermoanaerobaculia bacterium]
MSGDDRANRWLLWIIAAAAVLIPLTMSASGEDTFRYPKELALRLEVILLVVTLVWFWAFERLRLPLDVRQKWPALTAMICCWTILTTLFSTNRLVSLPPTIRVLEYALVFVVTVLVLRGRPLWIAGVIVPSAIVNAAVYILQEFEIWEPFDTSHALEKHLERTALIGNPNDVGSYFVVPALIAATLALVHRRGRVWWAGAAIVLIAATFITHTIAAIGALIVALVVLAGLWLRSWPKALGAFLVLVLVAGAVSATYPPLRQRLALMREAVAHRDYEALSAARMLPFFAAAEMTRDQPLLGVGPGCFSYNFFEYKLRVQQRHRWLFGPGITGYNFGEVHNDHLQVASETGLPGYALFMAALVLIAAGSLPRRAAIERDNDDNDDNDDSPRGELVRLLSLPLALSLFVLALAQFPLELVAPTHAYLWGAGILVSWRRW